MTDPKDREMVEVTECATCLGQGVVESTWLTNYASIIAESPPDPIMVPCADCDGAGYLENDDA